MARACPITQRRTSPPQFCRWGPWLSPVQAGDILAVGERYKESTAGRGERMPVWGDAHRFAGEKRGFPASVLMAGERKKEGWGAGWHRHGATALPAPHPRYPSGHGGRCSRGRMAQRRAGRRCGAPGLIRSFLRHSARLRHGGHGLRQPPSVHLRLLQRWLRISPAPGKQFERMDLVSQKLRGRMADFWCCYFFENRVTRGHLDNSRPGILPQYTNSKEKAACGRQRARHLPCSSASLVRLRPILA